MADNIQHTQSMLNQQFEEFQKSNPSVAEAMRVMNISYQDYLTALAAMQEQTTLSTNSAQIAL